MKTESTQSLEMAWLIHSVANNWHAGERHRNTQLTSKVKCRLSSPITQVCRAITATARQHSHKGIRNMPGHAAGRARPNSSRKTARFRSPTLRWLRLRSTVNAPARIELPNHRGLTVGLILKRCRTGALDTHWSRLPLHRRCHRVLPRHVLSRELPATVAADVRARVISAARSAVCAETARSAVCAETA